MKKTITIFICILLWTCVKLQAQTTTTFILDPTDEDATVDDYSQVNNYPNEIEYISGAWTITNIPTIWRNLFKFRLACIPPNAEIQSAHLSLFYADTNAFSNATDTSLTNSNESVIQRVTSAWYEDSVTWVNQPSTTTADEVILAPSTSPTQDYTNLDVTAMVQQMVAFPNENWGFLLKLTNEVPYARLFFASSDNPHQGKHPSLTVTYTVPDIDCFTLTLDANGEDATVDDYNPGNNYPNEIEYVSGTWTISSIPTTWRSFFKFELPCEITTATIQSAHLNLYYATVNNFSNAGHESLTHSNESVLQRVVNPWTEHSITWNNQPSTSSNDVAILLQSTSGTQDYLNLDVTAMVQQMITYPDSSFGFMLRCLDETPYARMLFASGDNPVASKHPTLDICYALPSGIHELQDAFEVSIYPNPASDAIYITAALNNNEEVTLMLSDILGQNLLSYKMHASELKQFRVALPAGITQGIYLMSIQTPQSRVTKKITVE